MGRVRQIVGASLAEDLAARVQQDDRAVGPADLVQRGRDRFGPQDHARSPAVGVVVHGLVPAQTPVAQVVDADRGQAACLDAARNALRQRALEHRREERQDLDLERPPRRLTALVGPGGARVPPSRAGLRLGLGSRPRARPRVRLGLAAAAQAQRLAVDDDLAPGGREDAHDRSDHGTSSSPDGPRTTSTSAPPAR